MYYSKPFTSINHLEYRKQHLAGAKLSAVIERDDLDEEVAQAAIERDEAERVAQIKKQHHILKKKERAAVNKKVGAINKAYGATTRQISELRALGRCEEEAARRYANVLRYGRVAEEAVRGYGILSDEKMFGRRQCSVDLEPPPAWNRGQRSSTPIKIEEDDCEEDEESEDELDDYTDFDYKPKSTRRGSRYGY